MDIIIQNEKKATYVDFSILAAVKAKHDNNVNRCHDGRSIIKQLLVARMTRFLGHPRHMDGESGNAGVFVSMKNG